MLAWTRTPENLAEQTTPEKFAKVLARVANNSIPGEALNALEWRWPAQR